MKRYFSIIFAFLLLLLLFQNKMIMAYSWDYLPGGQNYLTEDAFESDIGSYSTISPIFMKSNQDYVLSATTDYIDLFTYGDVVCTIYFYYGTTLVGTYYLYYDDFFEEQFQDIKSCVFNTPINVNNINMSFADPNYYFWDYGLDRVMLEEGTIFDEFEDYVPGTIVDTDSPEFSSAGTIISYIHSPITILEIKSTLTAYDVIDGNLTSSIVLVEDNYTPNKATLGVYTVIFEVQDSSHNVKRATINVEVKDILKPVFSNIGTITIPYPGVYTISTIKGMLFASDNYDGDISQDIVLVEDLYTAKSNIVGTYPVTFSVQDSSGNVTTYTQYVKVVDAEAPVISGTNSIVIGYDKTITIAEVLLGLHVVDNYDLPTSLVFVVVSDNYTINKYKLGNYEIHLSVTDANGNVSLKTVSIQVVDKIGPIMYFDSSVVQTYTNHVLLLEDFLHLINLSDELSNTTSVNVNIIYDSYSSHATVPGTYNLSLSLENDNNEKSVKEFQIIVKPSEEIVYELPEEESFFLQYKEYFMYGGLGLVIILSNLIWLLTFRRR
jgi:hypothetical protein